jgi:hypothetical protein
MSYLQSSRPDRDQERKNREIYELKMLEQAWRGAGVNARAAFMVFADLRPNPEPDERQAAGGRDPGTMSPINAST